jgi:DNA polymerase III epsilon subunit-like protein
MDSTPPSRPNAVRLAQAKILEKPLYIDTETTGLDKSAEVIEISIVEFDGRIIFNSLIKPTQPIPLDAQRIHGIDNEMIRSAPSWPVLWPQIREIFYGRTIAAYNAPFDLKMMQQTHQRYRLPWRETLNMLDVLLLYSDYKGVWDPYRRSMKYFKLEEAGSYFQIPLPNAHRSAADALLTRAVLHSIAGISYE